MRTAVLCWILLATSLIALAGEPHVVHEFAHLGAGGGIRSVILVLNPTAEQSNLQLGLFSDDGSPLALTVNGKTESESQFQLAAHSTLRIEISSASDVPAAGSARLTASRPVGAQLLFEISSNGNLVTQAAVEPGFPIRRGKVFIDNQAGQTGIALANVSDIAPIRVRLTLKDESGTVLDSEDLDLAPRAHVARFIGQFFSDADMVRGSLEILSTGGIALVTLQQTGLVLGTLPVIKPLS